MRRVFVAVTAGLSTGCPQTPQVPALAPSALEQQAVRQVIADALAADAAMRDADSLYLIGATVIADGRARQEAPRFAGVRAGGQVSITASALEITTYLAWGSVEYRWTAETGGSVATGRATFVLERLGGAWRIKHAHSSVPRPPSG
jgi:hypothetical protein